MRGRLPMIGQTLSHFRVLEKIGAGGMGDVYLAHDTELDRKVALKILPAELAASDGRRKRFKREAKAVAALNHPNIVTVFSVEEADGVHFITMELVRGKTVRELLPTDGLPLEHFLDIAIPLADAVAAAHREGITHRDLKPDNVMVTDEGRVKVLDFGLAKESPGLRNIDTDNSTQAKTQEGAVVGTPHYMSPEQAEGKTVDHRSDIFSLGTVFHEMTTGVLPFDGDTPLSVLSAIVKDSPPSISELKPVLPAELARIIERALEKDPERRYPTALELRDELEALRSGLASSSGTRSGARSLVTQIAGAVALVAAVAAGALLWNALYGVDRSSAPMVGVFSQVTSAAGSEGNPSLSPDGEFVVYTAGQLGGNTDIYRRRVEGETAFNLTEDSPGTDAHPAFSPDGTQIAFHSSRDGGGIFLMGATGESVTRLADFGYSPAWSPDGQHVVFATSYSLGPQSYRPPSELWTVHTESGETKLLAEADAVEPSWSPHGDRIAYWSISDTTQRDIWTMPAEGGTPVPVTQDPAMEWGPAWSHDGKYLMFSSDRAGSMNLWRVRIDESSGELLAEPQPVTAPSTFTGLLSVAQDGSRIAYLSAYTSANIESVAFEPDDGQIGSHASITDGSNSFWSVDISPDGETLALTTAPPQPDLFLIRRDGTGRRRLTNDASQETDVVWWPDGDRIAFAADQGDVAGIWAVGVDGRGKELLLETSGLATSLAWSPDGSRMSFYAPGDGSYVFDPHAAEPEPEALERPRDEDLVFQATSWCPDGTCVAGNLRTSSGRQRGIAVYTLETGEIEAVAEAGHHPLWLNDGRRLVYDDRGQLWLHDVETAERRSLLERPAAMFMQSLTIARDNRAIYFLPNVIESDIWVFTPDPE